MEKIMEKVEKSKKRSVIQFNFWGAIWRSAGGVILEVKKKCHPEDGGRTGKVSLGGLGGGVLMVQSHSSRKNQSRGRKKRMKKKNNKIEAREKLLNRFDFPHADSNSISTKPRKKGKKM